jgi:prepilin-type N-terminal cleavage/methylation domain-containing protein
MKIVQDRGMYRERGWYGSSHPVFGLSWKLLATAEADAVVFATADGRPLDRSKLYNVVRQAGGARGSSGLSGCTRSGTRARRSCSDAACRRRRSAVCSGITRGTSPPGRTSISTTTTCQTEPSVDIPHFGVSRDPPIGAKGGRRALTMEWRPPKTPPNLPIAEGASQMIDRIKTRLAREESGFTLIELLVVLIILAILLAIAIPSYLSFKDRANKTSAESAVRMLVPSVESYSADNTPGSTNDPDLPTTSDNGYQGMTITILHDTYDQSINLTSPHEWVNSTDASSLVPAASDPTATTYCIVAQTSDWYAWKAGPDQPIQASKTVGDVCTLAP